MALKMSSGLLVVFPAVTNVMIRRRAQPRPMSNEIAEHTSVMIAIVSWYALRLGRAGAAHP